ncbi:MAG: MmcQ/YjbR family DNA-binding protein [Leucobacter sp.]
MATLEDLRKIALGFPQVYEQLEGHRGGVTWRTKRGLIVWERSPSKTDIAQLAELGRTYPDGPVVGIHVDQDAKEALLGAYPDVFFTIPHFDGYPAVLARLEALDVGMLYELVAEAWLLRVPKSVAAKWLEEFAPEG